MVVKVDATNYDASQGPELTTGCEYRPVILFFFVYTENEIA